MNLSPFKTKASALTLLFQKPALHGTHRKFYYLRRRSAGKRRSGGPHFSEKTHFPRIEPDCPDEPLYSVLSESLPNACCLVFQRLCPELSLAASDLFLGVRTVFFFSAICGIIMILVWNRYCEDAPVISIENASIQGSSQKNSFLSPLLLCIMLTIVLQGMLRDEVTTWMPSYISETYHLSHAAAILTGVLLPLFGLLCIQSASSLYIRKFSTPLSCAGVFFFTGTLSSLALFCSTGKNAAFSVFFSALLTGCMHGVNLIQVCMIPPFFKKQGNVSTVSGVLNSCTYIGSATSTYGIAVLSDRIGWSSTLLIWVLLTFAGTLICIACARPWRKKFL